MAQSDDNEILYEWQADEFNYQAGWNSWVWVILALVASWTIWARQWVALATIAMIVVVVILQKRMQPRRFVHQITELGVVVGGKLRAYKELKSFWIVLDGETRVLNLLPDRKVGLLLTLQLGDANVDKVRESLAKFLPEDANRGEDTVDRIGRFFRL